MGYRPNILWKLELDMPHPYWIDHQDAVTQRLNEFVQNLVADIPVFAQVWAERDHFLMCEGAAGFYEIEARAEKLGLSEEDAALLIGAHKNIWGEPETHPSPLFDGPTK